MKKQIIAGLFSLHSLAAHAGDASTYEFLGPYTVAGNGEEIEVAPNDAPLMLTWEGALEYCENLVLNGSTDWQMPTKNQVLLMFEARNEMGLKNTFNTLDTFNPYSNEYWAYDPNEEFPDQYHFSFGGAWAGWGAPDNEAQEAVRCVRDLT